MLQAYDQQGKLVNLAVFTKMELHALKLDQLFYCPVCKEHVIIKAGNIVLAHFAHLPKSNCPYSSGGEGPYHEQGKSMIFQWLERQRFHVQMEAYLPSIQQRPDILLDFHGRKTAIEYQCARLSQKEFLKRNSGYRSLNITPLWILGGNRMKRKGPQTLSLNKNDLSYLHQFSSKYPPTMYFFCSASRQFSIYQHTYLTGTKKAYGTLHFGKIDRIQFTDLFKKIEPNYRSLFDSWLDEKIRYRLTYNLHPSNSERKWLEWIYNQQLHPSLLPSIVHLPVNYSFLLNPPPWVWQSVLCLKILSPLPLASTISLHHCTKLLTRYLKPASFYPLIKDSQNPILEYLHLLVSLGFLQEEGRNQFVKKKPVRFPSNMDQAREEDKALIKYLQANSALT